MPIHCTCFRQKIQKKVSYILDEYNTLTKKISADKITSNADYPTRASCQMSQNEPP